MRDLKAELSEWNGSFPPAWNPEPGETLVGRIIATGEAPNRYGEGFVNTVGVEDEDNNRRVTVWLTNTVLCDLFNRKHPGIGDRIGLKFLGKHPDKGYRQYHLIVDEAVSYAPRGGEVEDDGF